MKKSDPSWETRRAFGLGHAPLSKKQERTKRKRGIAAGVAGAAIGAAGGPVGVAVGFVAGMVAGRKTVKAKKPPKRK